MKNTSATITGILYVVATPIGNLKDITQRALECLNSVDVILAEDTRHTAQLCKNFGITKPIISYHEHNEEQVSQHIIQQLLDGRHFALVSDAGTPLINDPGYILVKKARLVCVPVIPVPGCCALITALCVAGVPTDCFTFIGFLPAKSKARTEKLIQFKAINHTVICYESTHRILASIKDIIAIFGENYSLVLAKELTKNYEQFLYDSASAIYKWLTAEAGRTNGEFVLIFPPSPKSIEGDSVKDIKLLQTLLSELPLKQAVKIASQLSDTPKNILYDQALLLKHSN